MLQKKITRSAKLRYFHPPEHEANLMSNRKPLIRFSVLISYLLMTGWFVFTKKWGKGATGKKFSIKAVVKMLSLNVS